MYIGCYLGVVFDTNETDDKEITWRVIEARKCIACLNGILWSKDIMKGENWTSIVHWLKAVYYVVPKHGDSQKIIKDGLKLQRWMPREDPLEYQEKTE